MVKVGWKRSCRCTTFSSRQARASHVCSQSGLPQPDRTYEASPGPRELLERILAQVVVAKRVSESAKLREEQQQLAQQEPTDSTKSGAAAASTTVGPRKAQAAQEAQRLVDFCDVIVKAVGKIDNALRQSKRGEDVLKAIHGTSGGSNDSGKAVDVEGDISEVSDEDLKTAYKTWARENKYDTYDWTMPESLNTEADKTLGPSYKHTYSKEARSIQSFPSRNTALMKEVCSRLSLWLSRCCWS